MKVIYEFNDEIGEDDHYRLKVFQHSNMMFEALTEISDYLRGCRKGWNEDDAEMMEERISNIIFESNIGEIE